MFIRILYNMDIIVTKEKGSCLIFQVYQFRVKGRNISLIITWRFLNPQEILCQKLLNAYFSIGLLVMKVKLN